MTNAFPIQAVSPKGEPDAPIYGMTMRQYYKAAALAGAIADTRGADLDDRAWVISEIAGEIADAMIAEDEQHEREAAK